MINQYLSHSQGIFSSFPAAVLPLLVFRREASPVDHAWCHSSLLPLQLLQLQTQLRPPPSLDPIEKEPALESLDGLLKTSFLISSS